jgi:hypothetical protein
MMFIEAGIIMRRSAVGANCAQIWVGHRNFVLSKKLMGRPAVEQ